MHGDDRLERAQINDYAARLAERMRLWIAKSRLFARIGYPVSKPSLLHRKVRWR